MKYALLTAVAALSFVLVLETPAAHAVKCAQGANRAGCVGPHGAAGVNKKTGKACTVRNGVKTCN
jgi:hypothetical protein